MRVMRRDLSQYRCCNALLELKKRLDSIARALSQLRDADALLWLVSGVSAPAYPTAGQQVSDTHRPQ
jgi:hypothetical protein